MSSLAEKRSVTAIDAAIGRNIMAERKRHGLTCEDVAVDLDVSAWQVSKYEQGRTRVTAARLFLYAQLFKVPVSRFYRGIEVHHG